MTKADIKKRKKYTKESVMLSVLLSVVIAAIIGLFWGLPGEDAVAVDEETTYRSAQIIKVFVLTILTAIGFVLMYLSALRSIDSGSLAWYAATIALLVLAVRGLFQSVMSWKEL